MSDTFGRYGRTPAPAPPERSEPTLYKTIRTVVLWAALALVLLFGGCSLLGRGQTVEPGNVGVKIKTIGSGAGVSPEALPARWYYRGFGERIVQYPVIQRTYSYTREADERGAENEEIIFTDRTGLPMSADVAATIRVDQAAAPRVYTKYKLTFDQLLEGPIRNDIRSAIAAQTETVGVEQLLAGGRQPVIQKALGVVQRKWAADGVQISQLEWIGSIRFPAVIQEAIKSRTQADQQTLAATARVAVAEAMAREKVAIAQGDAEAYRLRGEALRANPEVLQQQAIIKWNGQLPQVTSGATPFVNLK